MKRIDKFLHDHQVDVSRSIALLLFVSAFTDITTMLGSFLTYKYSFQLGFVISVPLGISLWKYSAKGRKVMIILTSIISALMGILFCWMALLSLTNKTMHRFHITLGNTKIEDPSTAQIVITSLTILGFIYVALSIVYSSKFYKETHMPKSDA